VHDKEVIALCNELVGHKRMGPMAVDATFAVDYFFDKSAISYDSHVTISNFQHV
jgi:hypothetical protein